MAVVVVVDRDRLERPGVAHSLLVAHNAGGLRGDACCCAPVDAYCAGGGRHGLVVAVGLSVADPIAYADGHSPVAPGSAWPLAGILSASVARGRWRAPPARVAGRSRPPAATTSWPAAPGRTPATSRPSPPWCSIRARRAAPPRFAAARLRACQPEHRALRRGPGRGGGRHLHDGVLQTLAVVQRGARTTFDLAGWPRPGRESGTSSPVATPRLRGSASLRWPQPATRTATGSAGSWSPTTSRSPPAVVAVPASGGRAWPARVATAAPPRRRRYAEPTDGTGATACSAR